MNTEYATTPAAITKLAETIMAADAGAAQGRASYLRSLLAATQTELIGKPVLRVTGRAKRPELDQAVAAFERANKVFYDAVLAAVPQGLTTQERQSKTSFARSSGATLRRAIATGWNPLAHAVGSVTKAQLAVWRAAHATPRAITPKRAEKAALRLAERIKAMVEGLDSLESARILQMTAAELTGEQPQRIVGAKLTRHERAAAH